MDIVHAMVRAMTKEEAEIKQFMDRLWRLRNTMMERTGNFPDCLLLGHQQIRMLRKWATSYPAMVETNINAVVNPEPLQLWGIRILHVMQDSFEDAAFTLGKQVQP